MSVFDSILDGISSLGDWVSDNEDIIDTVGSIGKAGLQAYGTLQSQGKEKESYAQNNLMRYAALRGTRNNFDPEEADYGLKNYAPDPDALMSYWHNKLTSFVDVASTGVKPNAR